ncbi:MAG: GNAT family N-acetyltransferase [Pseudomonadota bacterium]
MQTVSGSFERGFPVGVRLMPLTSAQKILSTDELANQLDAIFFGAAARQDFIDASERAEFRYRWLGRYLERFSNLAWVALSIDDGDDPRPACVVGYVVGSLGDPAADPHFSDLTMYKEVRLESATWPAHLHINLAPVARNAGLGGRLVQRFAAAAFVRGARGLHVVTGAHSRNHGFYRRLGLQAVATLSAPGNQPAVMLASRLPL